MNNSVDVLEIEIIPSSTTLVGGSTSGPPSIEGLWTVDVGELMRASVDVSFTLTSERGGE